MYSLILHGRRLIEFQKWRHLRSTLDHWPSLSNSFSSAADADGRKGNNFTVDYLVESLGFTTKLAESVWRKATSEVKGDIAVGRYYDFVKDIVEADKSSNYEMSCLSLPEGTRQENIIRNVLVLRRLGVPQKLLFSLLVSCSHIVSGKERFEESLKKVVEMGFVPRTSKFVEALRIVYQMSGKKIEDKVNLYKKLGFTVEDVWEMFKKYPFLLAISEKNIFNSFEAFMRLAFTRDEFVRMVKHCPQCIGLSSELVTKKTEFLLKTRIWSLEDVVSNPAVFGYSLEKRIVPRYNVIKALIIKGGGIPSVGYILVCTDEVFLNRYVRKHNDKELVAELMAIFTGDRAS
ncbi:hypothetical protein N665_0008s0040 [Sinapis alba]|nr:hypothetical protein N665_0008s0040 [Sinapis alba]